MAVSELEQDLACHDSQSDQFRNICALIEDPAVDSVDALRLVMLFALRYETNRGTKVMRGGGRRRR
jgi:vacuolar protein sorting-associated protein 45